MFTAGLLISASSAYLMPEQNTGSIIYADTRILDPRYARSAEDLVCTREQHSEVKFFPISNGGGKGGGKVREMEHDQMIPIGCCPAGDPNGKPYGAGKGCCCGTVFNDDGNNFCCESDCQVYGNTLSGITKCNLAMGDVDYPWDSHGTMPPTIPPYTTVDPWDPSTHDSSIDYELACPSAFYIPSPMTAACSDANNEGSFCSFSCPGQLKVRIPDDPNRVCQDGEWRGDIPTCCEKDGCPDDLRVDFYFILDSSSSIKDKNFQYIREYVVGLISTMPIGQDKTRVGIITYNADVTERVRLDQFDDKAELIDAVMNIPYEGRGTKTNKALEYAVQQGIIQDKGDRPDVPNFVLVLTDGRSTDDVSIGAPALRDMAYVIAVGVGKKIKEPELVTIAGAKDNVYMVADFRSLGMGNLAARNEGEKVSEEQQLERNKICIQKELAESRGETFDYEGANESEDVKNQKAVIAKLDAKFEADGDAVAYHVAMRAENIRLQNLIAQSNMWSPSTCRKVTQNQPAVMKFTTSYICPKTCVFDQYTLFKPGQ